MPNKSTEKLREYRRKRDPLRTNEPFEPEPTLSPGQTRFGEFVVHLHDATRRHHDLRLQVGGVLKSFAVPRGPSLVALEKRLAVETEDHPIGYLDFEDVIPEHNYGAGAMIVWDRGVVRYLETSAEEGLENGKIDFELRGFKLKGRFALVRTSGRHGEALPEQPEWLLIKKKDAHASARDIVVESPRSVFSGLTVEERATFDDVRAALETSARSVPGAKHGVVDSRTLSPMLATLAEPAPARAGWLYELKLDGVRAIADRKNDSVSIAFRTQRNATALFPEIVRAIASLPVARVILDGEIVAFDEQGRPSFDRIAHRIHATRTHAIEFGVKAIPVVYVVFDVLALGDVDLRGAPLRERKRLLFDLVRGKGFVRPLDHLEDDGTLLFDLCRSAHLEGVVAKRADSVYVAGPRRTGEWLKFKTERDDDFIVVGFTRGERKRRKLGALDVASYDGEELVVRGKVGSGLNEDTIASLLERLEPLASKKATAKGELVRAPNGRVHVRPRVVVRVRYSGWTDEGRLRHPVFLHIRDDVLPEECRAAPTGDEAVIEAAEAEEREEKTAMPPPSTSSHRTTLSNQSKIYWPDDGYTKGDLCRYYEAIAPTMLAYLRDRPVVLVRYPDGIAGKHFYQWNLPKGTPTWIRHLALRSEEHDGKEVHTFLVDDVDTLLYVANLGCIPIHVLAARASSLASCDFMTLDIDLGGHPIRDGIELLLAFREVLDAAALPSFPKTSGQTGLHLLVPMGPHVSFDTARALADVVARIVEARHPKLATTERVKAKRGGRVYLDTVQTGRTRTIVAPYSVRAYPGARVSTPLSWDEVGVALEPGQFTITTVPDRVKRLGDPMAPLLSVSPDLPRAVDALRHLLEE